MSKRISKRVIGIEPWNAAGPGWANAGLTLIEESAAGKITKRTVCAQCFSPAERLAFQVALAVYPTLARVEGSDEPKERH